MFIKVIVLNKIDPESELRVESFIVERKGVKFSRDGKSALSDRKD